MKWVESIKKSLNIGQNPKSSKIIKPLGIDHVALNVVDLDKSLEFYTQILGLKVSEREFQKPGVEYFLDCGSSLVGLIQGSPEAGEHPFKHEGIGANHFSFRIPTREFDRYVEVLKENGVRVEFFKKREKSWSVYFYDPDGNKLEMTAWPQEDGEA